jgi:hypothetical protein
MSEREPQLVKVYIQDTEGKSTAEIKGHIKIEDSDEKPIANPCLSLDSRSTIQISYIKHNYLRFVRQSGVEKPQITLKLAKDGDFGTSAFGGLGEAAEIVNYFEKLYKNNLFEYAPIYCMPKEDAQELLGQLIKSCKTIFSD